MKKGILTLAMILVMPLIASMAMATAWNFVIETDAGIDGGSIKAIGKPASSAVFDTNGDCDTGGAWAAGTWPATSFVHVPTSEDDGIRIGTAYFTTAGIARGTNIGTLNYQSGSDCTQAINGSTTDFEKFTGND